MDVSQMNIAIAVADTESFAKAAKLLCLSPQTVKNQIDALEFELGCPLFTRSQKGSQATPEGLLLVEGARRLVEETEKLACDIRNLRQSDVIRLACPRGSGQPLRDAICSAYLAAFPSSKLKYVLCDEGQTALSCLFEGNADVAFGIAPQDAESAAEISYHSCRGIPLARYEAVVSRFDELSGRESVEPCELFRRNAVLARKDMMLPAELEPFVDRRHGFSDPYEAANFCFGGGVCVTNSYMPITHGGLVSIPVDVEPVEMRVAVTKSSNELTRAFVDFCIGWTFPKGV